MTSRQAFQPGALIFEPRLEERVWGGSSLGRYGKTLPPIRAPGGGIGESWEISDVEGKPSRVARGAHRGKSLREIVDAFPEEVLGRAGTLPGPSPFPLLLKLLDAREDLSVQVHPSSRDRGKGAGGKTESWIILEAEPGARVIHGLAPGVRRSEFYARMEALGGRALPSADVEATFRWVEVSRGDVIHVPAGTIHAIGKGVLLLEVQETSDVTYRIHDWGRMGSDGKPRALHVKEARAVSDPGTMPCPLTTIERAAREGRFAPLVECECYRIEVLSFAAEPSRESTRGERFHVLAGIEGKACYSGPGGDRLEVGPGDFTLLPAALGDYSLEALSPATKVVRVQAADRY